MKISKKVATIRMIVEYCLKDKTEKLHLANFSISNKDLEMAPDLINCHHIKHLDISNNFIRDFSFIKHFPLLETLNFSENIGLINNLDFLKDLPNLKSLNMSSCKFDNNTFPSELKSLTALNMKFISTMEDISFIGNQKNLV